MPSYSLQSTTYRQTFRSQDQFKGKFGCLICIDKTSYKYLTSIGKVVYMRHRWFLPQRHRWRAKDRLFDKTVENDLAPETRTGAQVFELTKNIKVVFRKGKKKAVRRTKRMDQNNTDATYEETALPFNKHSIFFSYLEYWKDQEVRHAIDLMHLEKNVFDSTIGTLLDIPSKTKDGLKLCTDLINLDIRHELHPKELANGKIEIPPACYSVTPEEKKTLCRFLHSVKVPTGFSSNIRKLVSLKDLTISGYNVRDCHKMLTVFLLIAI